MSMTPFAPRALWLDRFSMRLGRLVPALAPASVSEHAARCFDEAAELGPEEAAEIFALELPPLDVGAPGD